MNIRECFKVMLELDKGKVVTEELLPQLNGKSLYSDYQVGDNILHFMVRSIDNSKGYPEVNLKVKTVVERELEMMKNDFEFIEIMHGFPIFERKNQ